MKKLMILCAFCMVTLFSAAQATSVTIVNMTLDTLNVGGESVVFGTCGSPTTFGPTLLAPGNSTNFTAAPGEAIYRVGGSNLLTGSAYRFGWSICPFWNPAVCIMSAGTYTIVWNGCGYAEIH